MHYNSEKHHRRSIRLKGFDYCSAGAYFVTICTYNKQCVFGDVVDGKMVLNTLGKAVDWHWRAITNHFKNTELNEFVVMPNHVHGIIHIINDESVAFVGEKHSRHDAVINMNVLRGNASPLRPPDFTKQKPIGTKPQSLSAIIQNFKSITSRKINRMKSLPNAKLWQRNFYEQIIRHEGDLNRISVYISNNPAKWEEDKENPENWE